VIAGHAAPPYDAPVVEYISVTAAVSLIALSLGGQVAALPSSNASALAVVISVAKAQKVSVSGAKTALARAPYKKPVLRYLYAAGWIGGTKHQRSCLLSRISPRTAEEQATGEIRSNAKLKAQLRKRGVTAPTAAGALVKGLVSACS